MAKGKQGPEDFAQNAFRVFQQAIGEEPKEEPPQVDAKAKAKAKDPAAVDLGRRGGLKGGKARAASLTPEQRSDIARKAVQARWAKKVDEKSTE